MNTDLAHAHRFAVYFAPPPGSAWGKAGSNWLGRCTSTNEARAQAAIEGIDQARLLALTAEPRRYGWHATLKAPFVLADGASLQGLRAALQNLARGFAAFELPALRVCRMGGFLALRPERDEPALHAVARACVTQLHELAAPLSADELARRRHKGNLCPEEEALLLRWGYPYVMERYRFHLSLTGPLSSVDEQTVAHLQRAAQAHFGDLPRCVFDGLALFAEPQRGADFVCVERWGLSS